MAVNLEAPLAPGATIGILGSGQLGRMAAMAAASLGYRCHIYGPEEDAPANQVAPQATVAAYDDQAALAAFAQSVDVVTFEFENVPAASAAYLAEQVPVHPRPEVLHLCRNRLREKDFCHANQVPTTRYGEVNDDNTLHRVARDIGLPCVLKTTELGYDGKGQVMIHSEADLKSAWQAMTAGRPEALGILEGYVDFELEISVIVARALDNSLRSYCAVENQHRNHILDQTIVPARVEPRVAERAEVIARHLAEKMDLIGLLAVEMFVTGEGEVLVNELAPRPHNSGHWTIDACVTSQFEQFIRAVAGLPLGSTERFGDAVMKNLLGDDIDKWPEIVADPNAKLHLYGKKQARRGRKMGHVTRIVSRS